MKSMAEASAQSRVAIKGASVSFGTRYSPCLCSTNLSTEEIFESKHRETRGDQRGNFDLGDWRKVFSDSEGRFVNVYFNEIIPRGYRWAPQGPEGPVHRCCGQCGQRLWSWLSGYYCNPRSYTAADIHRDSDMEDSDECPDAECDDRVECVPEIGSLTSLEEKKAYLTRGSRTKLRRHTRTTAIESESKPKAAVEWMKLTHEERSYLVNKRAHQSTGCSPQPKLAKAAGRENSEASNERGRGGGDGEQ